MVVVLAILCYVGARRNALLPEAESALSELKTMGWAYCLQYGTFTGITLAAVGFQPPDDTTASCWDITYGVIGADSLAMVGTGDNTPVKCTPASGAIITVTLDGGGGSTRALVWP